MPPLADLLASSTTTPVSRYRKLVNMHWLPEMSDGRWHLVQKALAYQMTGGLAVDHAQIRLGVW